MLEFEEATIAMNSIFWDEVKVRCSQILENKRAVDYSGTVNDTNRQTVAHRCKELNF